MEIANKPLTLEQLKQMNGQPVWWWNKSQKPTVTICLFDRFSKEPSFVSYDFVSEDATKISKYSLIRRWGYLPYASDPTAQQQARIDREKWVPCEHCKPAEYPPDYYGPHSFPIVGNEIYFYDTDDGWEGEEIKFCPWCCRPLTEEAWAELERRLMG